MAPDQIKLVQAAWTPEARAAWTTVYLALAKAM